MSCFNREVTKANLSLLPKYTVSKQNHFTSINANLELLLPIGGLRCGTPLPLDVPLQSLGLYPDKMVCGGEGRPSWEERRGLHLPLQHQQSSKKCPKFGSFKLKRISFCEPHWWRALHSAAPSRLRLERRASKPCTAQPLSMDSALKIDWLITIQR